MSTALSLVQAPFLHLPLLHYTWIWPAVSKFLVYAPVCTLCRSAASYHSYHIHSNAEANAWSDYFTVGVYHQMSCLSRRMFDIGTLRLQATLSSCRLHHHPTIWTANQVKLKTSRHQRQSLSQMKIPTAFPQQLMSDKRLTIWCFYFKIQNINSMEIDRLSSLHRKMEQNGNLFLCWTFVA